MHLTIKLLNIGDISNKIKQLTNPPISVIRQLFIDRGNFEKGNNKQTKVFQSKFSSLLVGAPRDHSSHDIISRRGAVWKCEFQDDQICQRLPFRRDGEAVVRVGTSFDNKTDQWLGASIAANDGNIIVNVQFLLSCN